MSRETPKIGTKLLTIVLISSAFLALHLADGAMNRHDPIGRHGGLVIKTVNVLRIWNPQISSFLMQNSPF